MAAILRSIALHGASQARRLPLIMSVPHIVLNNKVKLSQLVPGAPQLHSSAVRNGALDEGCVIHGELTAKECRSRRSDEYT